MVRLRRRKPVNYKEPPLRTPSRQDVTVREVASLATDLSPVADVASPDSHASASPSPAPKRRRGRRAKAKATDENAAARPAAKGKKAAAKRRGGKKRSATALGEVVDDENVDAATTKAETPAFLRLLRGQMAPASDASAEAAAPTKKAGAAKKPAKAGKKAKARKSKKVKAPAAKKQRVEEVAEPAAVESPTDEADAAPAGDLAMVPVADVAADPSADVDMDASPAAVSTASGAGAGAGAGAGSGKSVVADSSTRVPTFHASEALDRLNDILSKSSGTAPSARTKQFEELQRQYSELQSRFDDLKHLRLTDPEAALKHAEAVWAKKHDAQARLIEQLQRGEPTEATKKLGDEAAAANAAAASAKAEVAALKARVAELEAHSADVAKKLEETSAVAAQAAVERDACLGSMTKLEDSLAAMADAYQQMTGLSLEISHDNENYMDCVALNPATEKGVAFGLEVMPAEEEGEEDDVEYTPITNVALLPEYLQEPISFKIRHAPQCILQILQALAKEDGSSAASSAEEDETDRAAAGSGAGAAAAGGDVMAQVDMYTTDSS